MPIEIPELRFFVLTAAVFAVGAASGGIQRGSAGYLPQIRAGDRALAEHRYSSAAYAYRYALEWNTNGVEAHVGLGYVYLKTGKRERALDQFAAALHIKPHSDEAERGIHLARTPSEEESAFQDLVLQAKAEPNNADVQTTYSEELIERGRRAEAKDRAEAALKLNPNMWHAYCALGRIAAHDGDDQLAEHDLEIAVGHDDQDDDAIETLGDIATKHLQYTYAEFWYRKLVKILPDERAGYEKLISTLDSAGKKDEADRVRAQLAILEQRLQQGDS